MSSASACPRTTCPAPCRPSWSLPYLRYLRLDYNLLDGPIPTSLGTLAALEVLDLSGNQLAAGPAELGGLSVLVSLNLSANLLASGIPASLAGLANLTDLDLSQNALTGPIPPELGGLANLRSLGLYPTFCPDPSRPPWAAWAASKTSIWPTTSWEGPSLWNWET